MQPGDTKQGYQFIRVLGRGGRAIVWEAVEITTHSRVALKILDTHAVGASARFAREFSLQARLDHPNVVGVHAMLEIDSHFVLACDLVDGPTLNTWIKEHKPTEKEALQMFGGILRGLRAAHEAGLVHRDLKPSNVMISLQDPPVPRIGDFGEVKSDEDNNLTQSGMVLGTLRYMAPEQLQNASAADVRSDLFSAGCILFELLTGSLAFDAPNKVAVMNHIRLKQHTPYPDSLAPRLVDLLDRMLDPNPDARPSSCDEVLDYLGLERDKEVDLQQPTPHTSTNGIPLVILGIGIAISALVGAVILVLWVVSTSL